MGELKLWVEFVNTGGCCTCGVPVVLESVFHKERLNDHKSFYCPNGHSLSYQGASEEEKLRKLLQKEREWRDRQAEATEHQRKRAKAAERREAAQKGVVTRLKNRSAAGLCSCCNRSFQNLKRHMEIKHPEQVKASGRDV